MLSKNLITLYSAGHSSRKSALYVLLSLDIFDAAAVERIDSLIVSASDCLGPTHARQTYVSEGTGNCWHLVRLASEGQIDSDLNLLSPGFNFLRPPPRPHGFTIQSRFTGGDGSFNTDGFPLKNSEVQWGFITPGAKP
ncbi:MAG: hypothetical protein ABSD75_02855 [Terriglobales bacterium]|jgi:hypothetical protein